MFINNGKLQFVASFVHEENIIICTKKEVGNAHILWAKLANPK
jgi:hypothetical protein